MEIPCQEANEEDAVVPSEGYPFNKYMEVYYPSLLWCGEQRQGEGLVIAIHWLLVPSTSHFTDYCKIKKEKQTGKTRKGVYKVRAPPPSQCDMLRLLFPLVDPLSLTVPFNAWLVSKFVAFLLHNLKFKISTLEMILFFFNDKMEKLYRFELKKKKKRCWSCQLIYLWKYTKFSYNIDYVYIYV